MPTEVQHEGESAIARPPQAVAIDAPITEYERDAVRELAASGRDVAFIARFSAMTEIQVREVLAA